MSLEQQIKELNETMKKVVSIFEVYPNPIDEKVIDQKKVEVSKANVEESPITDNVKVDEEFRPEHTHDELADLTRQALQKDKATNAPKLKAKLNEHGIAKVTLTPHELVDEMYEFLKALV